MNHCSMRYTNIGLKKYDIQLKIAIVHSLSRTNALRSGDLVSISHHSTKVQALVPTWYEYVYTVNLPKS